MLVNWSLSFLVTLDEMKWAYILPEIFQIGNSIEKSFNTPGEDVAMIKTQKPIGPSLQVYCVFFCLFFSILSFLQFVNIFSSIPSFLFSIFFVLCISSSIHLFWIIFFFTLYSFSFTRDLIILDLSVTSIFSHF